MSEFTKELRQKLNTELLNEMQKETKVYELLKKIDTSSTFDDVYKYSEAYSGIIERAIQNLGIDEWMYGTAQDVWSPYINAMLDDVTKACVKVQTNKNKSTGIGISPQTVKPSQKQIDEMIREYIDGGYTGSFSQIASVMVQDVSEKGSELQSAISKLGNKHIDKTQEKNINFLQKSGFDVYITRTYDGRGVGGHKAIYGDKYIQPCQWCIERAGSFKFKSTEEARVSTVFERHQGCGCKIDYECRHTRTRTTL